MIRAFESPGALEFIKECLAQSPQLSVMTLNQNFTIIDHNIGFSNLMGVGEKLVGEELPSILLPESRPLLTAAIIDQKMPLMLNFRTRNESDVSLDCHLCGTDEGYLLFGAHQSLSDSDILRKMATLNNEMAALTRELNRKNRALVEAKAQIKTLGGLLPICMYCKKIRDDEGYWSQLESFIEEHSEAHFSHGICEKCAEEKFPELLAKRRARELANKG